MTGDIVTLNDICIRITDGSHFSPKDIKSGIPFLSVKDIGDETLDFEACSKISETDYIMISNQNSSPKIGDVLFSKDGTVGKVHVVTDGRKFGVLSSIAILTPNSNLVLPEYLGLLLESNHIKKQLAKSKTGTALKRIVLKDIKKLKVAVPSVEKQLFVLNQIALVKDLLKKRNKTISLLHELSLSKFNSLERFSTSTQKTISDVVKVKGGKRLPKGTKFSSDVTNHAYIRVTDFEKNSLNVGKIKYISNETHSKIRNYIINSDDVYLSIAGTIGVAGIIPDMLSGSNLTENAARLVINDPKVLTREFLSFYLNSPYAQRLIRKKTMAVGVPKLAIFRIQEIPIFIPPFDEQKKFIDFVSVLNMQNDIYLKSKNNLQNIYANILNRASI